MGYLYIIQLQKGRDLAKPFYFLEDMLENWRNPVRKVRMVHKKEQKVKAGTGAAGKSRMQGPERSPSKQEQLDHILDKINRSGYDSLSAEEKAFLFKVSQED